VSDTKITEDALVKRINRKLAHQGERIEWGRDAWTSGECYRIVSDNIITGSVDDLEAFARDLGVLGTHETIGAAA
jgi:hypothetical protein